MLPSPLTRGPIEGAKLRVISLGAGVQSSTMALMAARGEIGPMPDAAIFADTGWEPAAVYEWLDWLEGQLPFPVYRVMRGEGLRADLLHACEQKMRVGSAFTTRVGAPPLFATVNGEPRGMLPRQCTREYKIEPIAKKQRELLGYKARQRIPAGSAEVWIGISRDEMQRVRENYDAWAVNRWPLLEMRMTRADCLRWWADNGLPTPPRSACIGCPYKSQEEWRLTRSKPDEWADAVEVDAAIRGGLRKTTSALYLHRQCVPLPEVDLTTPEERGQISFLDECEGMCGV